MNIKPCSPKKYHIPLLKKGIKNLKTKEIYGLLSYSNKYPTAVDKWIEYYPFLETFNWSIIFHLPSVICKEPRLQSLQYKILNRIISCNYNLHIWKIKPSPNCEDCEVPDTIEHYFFSCTSVTPLWKSLKEVFRRVFGVHFRLTVLEVLLGIPCEKESVTSVINFSVLFAKWYIYCQKQKELCININSLYRLLKHRIDTEIFIIKMIYLDKANTFCENWMNLSKNIYKDSGN